LCLFSASRLERYLALLLQAIEIWDQSDDNQTELAKVLFSIRAAAPILASEMEGSISVDLPPEPSFAPSSAIPFYIYDLFPGYRSVKMMSGGGPSTPPALSTAIVLPTCWCVR